MWASKQWSSDDGCCTWDHSGDRQHVEDGQADGSCGREHKRTCQICHNGGFFVLPFILSPQCVMPLPSCPSLLLPAWVTGESVARNWGLCMNYPEVLGSKGWFRRESEWRGRTHQMAHMGYLDMGWIRRPKPYALLNRSRRSHSMQHNATSVEKLT